VAKPSPLRVIDSDAPRPDLDRIPPHNIGAEQVVLGAAMLSPAALAEVRKLTHGGEFYRPAHVQIWEAITALADRGAPFDPLAVGAELGRDLTNARGALYLHTLIAQVPTVTNAGYYACMVRDLAYARTIVDAGDRLTELGYAATGDDATNLRAAVAAEVTAVTSSDVRRWAEPTPLTATTTGLSGFPLWTFPDWLGEYAASLAEVTQTPPDLAGCLALAVLAVAAGGKVWIQAPAWREPANLFTVVVLPPGNRKSEVYRAMCAPIKAAEQTLITEAEPSIAEAAIARRIAEAYADKTAKTAESAIALDPTQRALALAEATEAKLGLDAAVVPARPRLYSDDATVEVLTSLLCEQGGRMAVLSPEGEIFSIAAGRYSGAPNFAVLKKGHAGEEMRVDRMGRDSEHIDAATVTLGICTQPGVLAELGDTPQFRDQGLLGRLLYAVPDSLLGHRKNRPDPMPAAQEATYQTTVKALVLSLARLPEPATLTFTPDAQDAITRLLADTEPRFRPDGDLAHITDWGGKLVGATVRIAGLLHLAKHLRDGWTQPISADTFADATDIGEYFTAHAKAAYDAIGADLATTDAKAVLDWARNTARTRFAARDAQPPLRARFKKVTDLDPALRVLETHGWIRRLPPPPRTGRGRPAATTYEVHPAALEPNR
jgi:replicative DNA helicase